MANSLPAPVPDGMFWVIFPMVGNYFFEFGKINTKTRIYVHKGSAMSLVPFASYGMVIMDVEEELKICYDP